MTQNIQISAAEFIERLKISCKLSSVIRETVMHRIIGDTARTEGIKVEDSELQQGADDFRVKYNLYNPAATWSWLQTNHLTGDDFEQLIYESVLTSKLVQHLFGDRIEPYFYEHQLDFTQAVLYEIVFDDFNEAIEQFYALEERETTFIEVARQYIQAPEQRRLHGYRGVLSRTALNSAISAAVFASSPPQLLKPIVVNKKAHLLIVEEIIEPQLDKALRSQISERLFSAWLEKQAQQYPIEVDTKLQTAQATS